MNRVLIIDHKDSFSHILLDYIIQLGWDPVLKQACDWKVADLNDIDWILISPGFGDPKTKLDTLAIIDHYIGCIPILGVCLGHQLLAWHQGAQLKQSERPLHGVVSRLRINHPPLPEHWEDSKIMHYHSWISSDVPNGAQVLARSSISNQIMGMMNLNRSYLSWQFHPESICTEYGLEILEWSIRLLMKK